ncbi:MAG: hypothetical protein HZB91_03670 [Elusimicrobia bacterium]|nr:hypothetical protein [Elusimicrobiota bacterium]
MKGLSAALLPCLLAAPALAGPAPSADSWLPAEQASGLIGKARSLSNPSFGKPPSPASCPAPAQGRDSEDCEGIPDLACGVFGSNCNGKRPKPKPAALDQSPINTGFRSMGTAGSKGKIDGPGKQGNGSFKVLVNDPFELSMEVKTGYIDGIITLKRDPATGKDSMRYQGRRRQEEAWGPVEDKLTEIVITYDAKTDRGRISWLEDGEEKSEGYWGGGKNDKVMTIEFGGGWDHDFFRD